MNIPLSNHILKCLKMIQNIMINDMTQWYNKIKIKIKIKIKVFGVTLFR